MKSELFKRRNFLKNSLLLPVILLFANLLTTDLFARPRGTAFLFYRPLTVLFTDIGHTGWGFYDDVSQKYYYGGTENPSGQAYIAPGGNNGAWIEAGSYNQMIQAMRNRYYTKSFQKRLVTINPRAAYDVGLSNISKGYTVTGFPGNNCADHSWGVINAYGASPALIAGTPSVWLATLVHTQEWKEQAL